MNILLWGNSFFFWLLMMMMLLPRFLAASYFPLSHPFSASTYSVACFSYQLPVNVSPGWVLRVGGISADNNGVKHHVVYELVLCEMYFCSFCYISMIY